MRKFIKICKMPQTKLKLWLSKKLMDYYPSVVSGDGFLYAKGTDILLTAHMDTVHKEECHEIVKVNKTTISSPQGIGGDDRCGIWIILQILATTEFRPSILFCEDEEIGGVGSNKFVKTEYIYDLGDLKYLVELDRKGSDDAVYYDCGNTEFKKYIESVTGYKEAYGSFSDISNLSPACDKASVNLSCGYYNAHTLQEYVVFEEMQHTVEAVIDLLADAGNAREFDYQELVADFFGWGSMKHTGYGWYIVYYGNGLCEDVSANSYEEAVGVFLIDHPELRFQDIEDVEEVF